MDKLPQALVIVLNWNGLSDTLECLESLSHLDYPAYEVVVVDNGSADGSVSVIREQLPAITVIENEENLGYAGGNNVGLRYALAQKADYALLLNNDTMVDSALLRLLVEASEANLFVGIVGPTIYYHARPNTIWSAGGAIDWKRGSTRMVGLNEQDVGQFGKKPREVDFVTGCALLVRMKAVETAGELDERFFMYYEETEWCVRIARAGYRIMHVPQAKMWHKISPEAQVDSPFVRYYMTRNRLLFLKATGATMRVWLHTLFAEYLRILISWSVGPKRRCMRAQRDIMVIALRDYFSKRLGKAPIGWKG